MSKSMTPYHSFIVRCWRASNGSQRGELIDALSQHSYPFASLDELVLKILSLMPAAEQVADPGAESEPDPGG